MIIIENAINESVLRSVSASWPGKSWRGWHHYSNHDSEKYGTKSRADLPPEALRAIDLLIDVASEHVEPGCFPDFDLYGAGMHMIPPGGYLMRHLDSSFMEHTGWKREYSCVLSCCPAWEPEWGGEFCIDGHEPVSPRFNQAVLFRTTEDAYHAVRPVYGPEPRCSLAVFFWSLDRPSDPSRRSARFFH